MSELNEVGPKPNLERRTRRQFSGAEKKRLVEEKDALPRGEKCAWLRRKGLYAVQLASWRKALAETGTQGLELARGGRKPADPREREIERLKRDKARLEQRLQSAEDLIELQKNSQACSIGLTTRTSDERAARTSGPRGAQPRVPRAGPVAYRHVFPPAPASRQ